MQIYFIFVLVIFSQSVWGHNIGVTEVNLKELPDHQYQLTVNTQGTEEEVITPPILPEGCQLNASHDSSSLSLSMPVFRFRCASDAILTASDIIVLTWRREAVLLHAQWLNGAEARALFMRSGEVINVALKDVAASSSPFSSLSKRYTLLGFEHILEGVDHLLFVLGVLLLVSNAKTLLQAITAFTVAHSITLALSVFNVLVLPAAPVETCIAFSIVILAYEVIRKSQQKIGLTARFLWVVAGCFGLLHGLGFAGALMELGVPTADVPVALLFFNIGVELGQITFVLSVIVLLWCLKVLFNTVNYNISFERAAKIPVAYVMGSIAMYWTLERGILIFSA